MRKAIAGTLAALAFFITSCSRNTEAQTRKDQEAAFRNVFEFEAPTSIIEIRYADVYQRNLMDSVYAQWIRFSYDEVVFGRLLKDRGFHSRKDGLFYGDLGGPMLPKWWPEVHESEIALYVHENEQTKKPGESSFREFLWHDKKSNYVYFHRRY